MKANRTWIFGATASLLTTLALMAALDSYLTQIQASAPHEVITFEPVIVTPAAPAQASAQAETQAKRPAAL
jgi:hypothetical protein